MGWLGNHRFSTSKRLIFITQFQNGVTTWLNMQVNLGIFTSNTQTSD